MKQAVLSADRDAEVSPSRVGADSGSSAKRDYVVSHPSVCHEVLSLMKPNQEFVDDAQCATVDTGCQRTAVGAETLFRFLAEFPEDMHAVYRPEHHSFKSINGVTSTDKVACIPTSLGQHGSILRPAIFESPETRDAPFLLSLPFLLHCQASLHLDPQEGLWMDLKRFNHRVPLLIGPTGALRVPLQAFSPQLKHTLRSALSRIEGGQEEILLARSLSSCQSNRASSPYPCPDSPDRSEHVASQQEISRRRSTGCMQSDGLLEANGSPLHGDLRSCWPPGLPELPDDSRPRGSILPELPRHDQAAQRCRASTHVDPHPPDPGGSGARANEATSVGGSLTVGPDAKSASTIHCQHEQLYGDRPTGSGEDRKACSGHPMLLRRACGGSGHTPGGPQLRPQVPALPQLDGDRPEVRLLPVAGAPGHVAAHRDGLEGPRSTNSNDTANGATKPDVSEGKSKQLDKATDGFHFRDRTHDGGQGEVSSQLCVSLREQQVCGGHQVQALWGDAGASGSQEGRSSFRRRHPRWVELELSLRVRRATRHRELPQSLRGWVPCQATRATFRCSRPWIPRSMRPFWSFSDSRACGGAKMAARRSEAGVSSPEASACWSAEGS